jgi:hypothetical protein
MAMARDSLSGALRQEVVRRVRADVVQLVDRLTRRILTEIPFYLAGGTGAPEDLRQRVRANVVHVPVEDHLRAGVA